MRNLEIAWIFWDIADLLELSDENPFKIRAYRKAADTLIGLGDNFDRLFQEGKIGSIPGIGPKLAGKIEEIIRTGRSHYHEELKSKVPRGLVEIKAIPGVGPKLAQLFYRHLNITSIEQLEAAAREHRIRELPGMGSKSELAVLRGIELLRQASTQVPIGAALPLAEELVSYLKQIPAIKEAVIVGPLRRWREMIDQIVLLVVSSEPEAAVQSLAKHPAIKETERFEGGRWQGKTWVGVGIEAVLVTAAQFPVAKQRLTGSDEHNQQVQAAAHDQGLDLRETGLFAKESGRMIPVGSEEDLYRRLGLQYIPPEIREGDGEVALALESALPPLVQLSDIRGDLHMHTTWSDGANTLEEMVAAARKLGYEYMAVTDHSKSLAITHGLDEERLKSQREVIDRLNRSLDDFRVLCGTEVDILSNRTLDFADDVLADMDVVIASIHTGFKQDGTVLTERALSAVKNKHVDILSHPTGRILGRREPYGIDLKAVFAAAAEAGTAIEINASPDRLDLRDIDAGEAADMGIKIAINSDAHDTARLAEMRYGVATARRGRIEPDQVLNTMTLKQLRRYLKK